MTYLSKPRPRLDRLTAFQPVFDVEPYRILNQAPRLRFCFSLGVAALQPRADRQETPVFILLDDHCKTEVFHERRIPPRRPPLR